MLYWNRYAAVSVGKGKNSFSYISGHSSPFVATVPSGKEDGENLKLVAFVWPAGVRKFQHTILKKKTRNIPK